MANTTKTQKLEKALSTIVIDLKDIKHTYSTMQGVVIGKMWGGGMGSYSARDYKANTLKELQEKLQKAFDLGSLDSGAGFEKLLAAGVIIVDEASVEIEGKVFKSSSPIT